MNHKILLECCVDSVESALAACEGGADRLELCTALSAGGLSPTPSLYRAVKRAVGERVKINVLLRPRPGDFLYSPYEFEILQDEVRTFRELGADGIVIGMLRADGSLDDQRLCDLMRLGEGMSKTLHRAFDMANDPFSALEGAVALGFDTILTSGQAASAYAGRGLLQKLVEKAGPYITIMPGAGISAEVIEKLYPLVPARAFHMSGKVTADGGMRYRNPAVSMGSDGASEYRLSFTDKNKVAAARKVLDKCADSMVK